MSTILKTVPLVNNSYVDLSSIGNPEKIRVFVLTNWFGVDQTALGVAHEGVPVWSTMPLQPATTWDDLKAFIEANLPAWQEREAQTKAYHKAAEEQRIAELKTRQWNDLERFEYEHPCLKVKKVSSQMNHLIHGKFYSHITEFRLPAVEAAGFLGAVWAVEMNAQFVPTHVAKAVFRYERGKFEQIAPLRGITEFRWLNPDPSVLKSFLKSINKPLSKSVREIWEDDDRRQKEFEKVIFVYDGEDNFGIRLIVKSVPEVEYPQQPSWEVGTIVHFPGNVYCNKLVKVPRSKSADTTQTK